MKEKMQEFEISVKFHFDADMTVEFETEKEAISFARKHFISVVKDHLRDSNNIVIHVKKTHTISPEERASLERDGIIEPVVKKERKKRTKKEDKEDGETNTGTDKRSSRRRKKDLG